MKIIGLTGGSGAGKGEVSRIFAKLGVPSVDTDAVYRELVKGSSECLSELECEFGTDIISPDGSLDRAALSSIVFAPDGSEKLKKLNEITHKFILAETEKKLAEFEKLGYKAAIVDAPQLFESGFNRICDCVIAVTANKETRIKRICARDSITRKRAEARIKAQLSDKYFKDNADFVIKNNGDLASLEKNVKETAEKLGVR